MVLRTEAGLRHCFSGAGAEALPPQSARRWNLQLPALPQQREKVDGTVVKLVLCLPPHVHWTELVMWTFLAGMHASQYAQGVGRQPEASS